MKLWPPKPGLTLITSTRSTLSITQSSTSSDAAGLKTRPALQPRAADQLQRAVDVRARLRMKADDVGAGLGERLRSASTGSTIRWTSIGTGCRRPTACLRIAAQTIGPIVRFGT